MLGGAVIPGIIVLVVLIATVLTQRALSAPERSDLTVEVTGYQFWWSVRYPRQGIVTANEIHIPVGQPVRVELASADVIHSFWVPKLSGKVDMFPGRPTSLILQADQPGTYRGECAEFCGVQHAHMALVVVALPEPQFSTWISEQSEPSLLPTDQVAQRGAGLFVTKDCVSCHSIRGIAEAAGADIIGPDLTHLASRNTLAAGTVDNTIGNLAAWIVDPHSIKPGSAMPSSDLSGEELQALLAFLESLE